MSEFISLLDKEFKLYFTAQEIGSKVKSIAQKMNQDLESLDPVFIAVLNGAFFFACDLLKEIHIPFEITFVKVASYDGLQSKGTIKTLMGLDESLKDRNVVVLEDIVDSGFTMKYLIEELQKMEVASVKIASLLVKPSTMKHPLEIHYTGFEVPDVFLVGYGLDYHKKGRNYKNIYILNSE